jgi:serine/threonine-protein kinase
MMKKILIPLLLLLVAIVAIDKLLMPFYISFGAKTSVPDVRNMNYAEAVIKLKKANLDAVKSFSVQYLPDVPPDRVIDQIPAPLSVVKPGRSIALIVNRTDKPTFPMPDLTGRTEGEARQELERIGIVVSEVQNQMVSDPVRDGRIQSQSVPPGVIIRTGSPVSLIVGRLEQEPAGLLRVVVPDVAGLSIDQARSSLGRSGLSVGRIRYEPSALLVPDTVISQNPKANALVQSGQPVELTAAKGE